MERRGLYPVEFDGIYLGDLYIHEPGGMLSNILVFGFSLYFALSVDARGSNYARNFKGFFFCLAVGGFGGSIVHGLPHLLGKDLFYYVWAVKNSFVPLANYFAMVGVLSLISPNKIGFWKQILLLKCVLAIVCLWWFYSFLPAVIDLAITYLLVIFLAGKNLNIPGLRSLRTAFLVALFSGTLYLIKYDLDPLWFTHKDMVHIFVIISLALIYRSVKEAGQALNHK